jgi:hypothetical protein
MNRPEPIRQLTPAEVKQIAAAFEKLSNNICPICDSQVKQQRQVGHCVYGEPCGHRLYQGTVGAFAPQEAS